MVSLRRFRNSALRNRRECGFAYRRTYVEGIEGLPSPDLQRGASVHDAIKLAIRSLINTGMLDIHEVAYRAIRGGNAEYAEALAVLVRFQEAVGIEFDLDADAVFLVESRLEAEIALPSGGPVLFHGTPDVAERVSRRRCRITDFKTHWHPESEEEFRADPQLERYALLVAREFPAFQEFELVKRFIRYANAFHTTTITRDDLEEIERRLALEIELALEAEEDDQLAATPGAWCALCAHHAACPVIAEFRHRGEDTLSIADDARAAELAGAAVAMDGLTRRLKAQVKRYLGADHPTGRVALAGGEYGYGPVSHREVQLPKLREAWEAKGAAVPDDVLRVDADALDRARRRLPDSLIHDIEAATRTWESSQARFRRVAPPEAVEAAVAAGELF